MKPYHFSDQNLTLVKPASMTDDECRSITAYSEKEPHPLTGQPMITSITTGWLPSKKDIEAMAAGRPLIMRTVGGFFAPVAFYTQDEHGNVNPEEEESENLIQSILQTDPPSKSEICSLTDKPCSCESNELCSNVFNDEKKFICPNPTADMPCADCPPQGCYFPEALESRFSKDGNAACNCSEAIVRSEEPNQVCYGDGLTKCNCPGVCRNK